MDDLRARRLAQNEAAFRVVNERMAEWEEIHGREEEPELYTCECADPDCREKVPLTKQQYEYVRSNSRWFVIATGHDITDIETVLEDHGGWAIIEKNSEAVAVVEKLDPRT